jgi:ubiquinone/menaquinone biosynthesis C-methylase UbiE
MVRIEQERYKPGEIVAPWVRHQHLERYRWASQFVAGRTVLDVASGAGYGTALLSSAGAARVDGFDCSEVAVSDAFRAFSPSSVGFAVASAESLPVASGSYDVYVSFETLEHVRSDDALLAEAARVLRTEGLFIVSTPNRQVLDPGTSLDDQPFNQYHVREYTKSELEEKLKKYFSSVQWFGQSFYRCDYIQRLNRLGRLWPPLGVRVHQLRKCLNWPWESADRHLTLADHDEQFTPEILIALCRTS